MRKGTGVRGKCGGHSVPSGAIKVVLDKDWQGGGEQALGKGQGLPMWAQVVQGNVF